MMPLTIQEIINATRGRIISSPADSPARRITGISTDTRNIRPGALFVALKGPNFDGHNFVASAVKSGAAAVLVSRTPKMPLRGAVIIRVADTLKALGNLARYYRNIVSAKIIAITGSNGKTTTKEMLAHILSGQGLTASSPKSFNNFIGVPLTIFSIGKKHRYGVLELGTNNPGEIAYLAGIVRPDIAIITNIAPAHLAGLKSVMGVAREKFSLFRALTPQGTAIFPGDNKILKRFTGNAEYNIETFSQTSKASIRALDVISSKRGVVRLLERSELQPTIPGSDSLHSNCQRIEFKVISSGRGKYPVRLSLLGNWNVDNALAAITAAKAVGVPVQDACRALSSFQPPAMRMQQEDINGITVINDAYNANPASVACAISELSRMPSEGRKIFVFGEMRELGRQAEKYHRAVGRGIARSNIDALITVGKSTRWTLRALPKGASLFRAYCNNVNEVIVRLKRILRKGDTVLLKGSRAVGLEKIGAEL